MLKCFHPLECSELENIQNQVLAHLNELYDFSDQTSLKTDLWLKIDSLLLLKKSPLLIKWTQGLGLKIRETALTVVNNMAGAGLHIDEPPVTAKINFPLLNYQNVINEWWTVPESIMQKQQPKINQFGSPYYSLGHIDLSMCTKIAEVEMSGPIVFNSQIPHRVVPRDGCNFPRVVLTCMFYKQPISYL